MARLVGYAFIGLLFLGIGCLMGLKMGAAVALAVSAISLSVTLLFVYALGLAITGDWQCWRDLIP